MLSMKTVHYLSPGKGWEICGWVGKHFDKAQRATTPICGRVGKCFDKTQRATQICIWVGQFFDKTQRATPICIWVDKYFDKTQRATPILEQNLQGALFFFKRNLSYQLSILGYPHFKDPKSENKMTHTEWGGRHHFFKLLSALTQILYSMPNNTSTNTN